jgi:hypothetical protein
MSEQLITAPSAEFAQPTAETSVAVGRTVLELLAKPVEEYGTMIEMRNPTSQPSTQRTWDSAANRPDTHHMVDWD